LPPLPPRPSRSICCHQLDEPTGASAAKLGAKAPVSAKMTVDNAKILDVVAFMIRSCLFYGAARKSACPVGANPKDHRPDERRDLTSPVDPQTALTTALYRRGSPPRGKRSRKIATAVTSSRRQAKPCQLHCLHAFFGEPWLGHSELTQNLRGQVVTLPERWVCAESASAPHADLGDALVMPDEVGYAKSMVASSQ
jgi:hypothetical protein